MGKRKTASKRARIAVGRSPRDMASPLQRILNRERGRVVEVDGIASYEEPANNPVEEQRRKIAFTFFKGRHQRTPIIDTMRDRKQLTEQEHRALAYYRDQAALSERSPTKSCLDNSQGGSGDIPIGAAITSAILTTARIERDMGQLWPIARAIAVDDKSLSQWCVDKHGGRERYDGRGKFVAIVPVREKVVMGTALMELRMAAHRIVL